MKISTLSASIILVACASTLVAQTVQGVDPTVVKFMEAFNAHDAGRMAELVTEDFELYYVGNNGKADQALQGPEALKEEMKRYFKGLPTVQSSIAQTIQVGDFVSFKETAQWSTGGDEKSQSSLGVYQLKGERIQRAWYYPAGGS